MDSKPSFVYLLMSSNGATYVGATIDLNRRLDQHNKLLKGGAKATGNRVENGEMWVRMAHVKNFPDWKSALQFEWRWKDAIVKIIGENWHKFKDDERVNNGLLRQIENLKSQVNSLQQKLNDVENVIAE